MSFYLKVILGIFVFGIMYHFTPSVFAQGNPGPAGIPQLEHLFSRIVCITVPIGYTALIVVLVFAGFKYLTSSGEAKAIASAHQTVTWGLLGILFMVIAWLILQLIQNFAGVKVTNFTLSSLPGVQGFSGSCWAEPPVAPTPSPLIAATPLPQSLPQAPTTSNTTVQANNPAIQSLQNATIADLTNQLMPASIMNFEFGCRHIQNLVKAYFLESINPIPNDDPELTDVFNTAKNVPKEWLTNITMSVTDVTPNWQQVGFEIDLSDTTNKWHIPLLINPADNPNQPPAKLSDDGNVLFYTYRTAPIFYFVPKNRKNEIKDPSWVDASVWTYIRRSNIPNGSMDPNYHLLLTKQGEVLPNKLPSQLNTVWSEFGLTTDLDEALRLGDSTTLFKPGTPNLALLYSMRSCPEGELWGIP